MNRRLGVSKLAPVFGRHINTVRLSKWRPRCLSPCTSVATPLSPYGPFKGLRQISQTSGTSILPGSNYIRLGWALHPSVAPCRASVTRSPLRGTVSVIVVPLCTVLSVASLWGPWARQSYSPLARSQKFSASAEPPCRIGAPLWGAHARAAAFMPLVAQAPGWMSRYFACC